jgi:hypothetical protein
VNVDNSRLLLVIFMLNSESTLLSLIPTVPEAYWNLFCLGNGFLRLSGCEEAKNDICYI